MIKANDPDIFDVKIDKFSSRKHQLFHIEATEPLPTEARNVSHGGQFYNRDNYSKFT